jgi:hypothetical protein
MGDGEGGKILNTFSTKIKNNQTIFLLVSNIRKYSLRTASKAKTVN